MKNENAEQPAPVQEPMADGATLRDYFAAKAIQSIVLGASVDNFDALAVDAYKLADSMLKARGTPQAQPAREWVGLTEEEKTELRRKHYPLPLLLMDATEAKLKEKNA